MYAGSEILRFIPGRRREGLDRLGWMHELMQEQQGFREALIAKYLGDATRFLVLRYWDDAEAYAVFRDIFRREYASSRPGGFYEIEENLPWDYFYERSESIGREASFLVATHRRVPAEVREQHALFQKEVEQLTFSSGGLAELRQLRSADGPDTMSVYRYAARDDFDRYFDSSPHLQQTQKWPDGIELISTKCYEVVAETHRQARTQQAASTATAR